MAGNRGWFVAALVAGGIISAAPVHAQSWRPFAKDCIREIDQAAHCGACSGSWPLWTKCIAQRAYGNQIPQATLKDCMQRVWDRRIEERKCALCGPDPVAESLKCAGAE